MLNKKAIAAFAAAATLVSGLALAVPALAANGDTSSTPSSQAANDVKKLENVSFKFVNGKDSATTRAVTVYTKDGKYGFDNNDVSYTAKDITEAFLSELTDSKSTSYNASLKDVKGVVYPAAINAGENTVKVSDQAASNKEEHTPEALAQQAEQDAKTPDAAKTAIADIAIKAKDEGFGRNFVARILNAADDKAAQALLEDAAEFKKTQDEAAKKAKNALLMKQLADGAVKALQKKVEKATGAEKTKLQEQLENAKKIARALDELNNKATSMVKAYAQAAEVRNDVNTLETKIADAQAKFNKLAEEQTGPAGSPEYDAAAAELGKLQEQLKSKKNLLEKANKGVTKAEETLVKQETKVQEVQNPKKEEPKPVTPVNPKPVTPEPKPVNPKPVTPVTPHHDNPSVTPSVTPTPSTPSDETPSDDTPSSTPSVTTPSASTPAGASQSAPSAAPAAGVPAAPASVADLLPALKGMITAGANNVVVAGAVNKVTLSISNQAFLDRLSRDGSAKAYAFIYSSPRLLKGADGANYVTVRLVNGKPQFDAMFPAGYSGKHTVVLVDEQGNQLGWTNITVKSGVSGLPNSGVGVALTALAASVLAGAGAAFRKIRH